MPEDKKEKPELDTQSTVVAGQKVEPKVVSADADGLDINTLKAAFVELKGENDVLKERLKIREQEDSETVRNVIVSKTANWKKPFTKEELKDASLEDLDQLHLFIQRAPDAVIQTDGRNIEKIATQIVKTRMFPKLSSDVKPYESATHRFQIGK